MNIVGLIIFPSQQRNEKRRSDECKKSQLTAERVQLLESIGFKWAEPRDETWDNHFNALVAYKEEV